MSSWKGHRQGRGGSGGRSNYRGRSGSHGGRGGRGGGGNQCYNCQGFGHFARDCPKNGGNGGVPPSNRDPERRFFDKVTKDPTARIASAQEATRLLKSALTFAEVEGASALLYRLADQELSGVAALKKSLEYMTEADVFVGGFLPIVDFLGREELHKPVYSVPLKYVLSQLYSLPFLVPCIAQHCEDGHVGTTTQRTALIWFFTMICLEHERARNDDHVKSIAESLGQHGGADSLKTILGGSTVAVAAPSLADVRLTQSELPGGRHDNDKQDFRSISIVPTLQEFLCDADPYLPKMTPESMTTATEAQLLDRQFRLLREDILGPSKEQLDDPRKERKDIVYGLRVDHVETGAAKFQGDRGNKIMGQTAPCISFKFRLPHWMNNSSKLKGKQDKEEYWERNRRFLPKDALVCLQRRNDKNEWVPIRFATIVRRQSKELAYHEPLIGLSFLTESDTAETLKELSNRGSPPTRLFVISGELFACAPILRGLQMMTAIPFSDEIIRSRMDISTEVSADITSDMSPDIQGKVKMLDTAQTAALQSAMKNRVALIQGPPGTGKTFIGVLLAQILLAATTEIILCVTYTNHALDDFLEDLLDVGIADIVRLGGRSKSDRLSEYNLREQASSGKAPFTREQNRRFAQLKGTIEEAEKDIARLERVLSREIGEKWWAKVGNFLQDNYPDQWEQLYVKPTEIKDSEGYRVHGISGDDHLWKCWLKGKQPPDFLRSKVDGALWRLDKERRKEQKLLWQHAMYEDERAEMATALATIRTAQEELKQLQEITDASILSKARVVGCTTTKAAMCKHLLDGLAPGIVLVEEAAEIMEPHILTSLSVGTKRLIMIGDHKQLRPKCQHYPLTVEAGHGFDLNRSLFERLALVIPISTLEAQHRMHPDISAIPKLITYPNLKDAPTVASHSQPMGLASRIVVINHGVEEDRETDSIDTMESVSRTNIHEVELVTGTVRYLFQQGYKPSDLVVLTPYLGQMVKIHNRLSMEYDVFVDENDLKDAREQLSKVELVGGKSRGKGEVNSLVRVATIDNYQGEEAKIVVISLVRSNGRGEIGFLKEPERVNVMLSRARDCEIIIGNRDTFENAKGSHEPLRGGPLWKSIFGYLETSGFIYTGLPVKCQWHGTLSVVELPSDFAKLCPDGGCKELCDKELACGHVCVKRCHVGPCIKCQVLCPDMCPRGHHLLRRCSDDPPECRRIISWRCPLNHRLSGPCTIGKYKVQCRSCLKMNEELQAGKTKESQLQTVFDDKYDELEKLNRQLADALQANEQENELARLENELTLAREALENALQAEVTVGTIQDATKQSESPLVEVGDVAFAKDLSKIVRTMLESAHPEPLDPNVLLLRYRDKYGTDLRDELKKVNSARPALPRNKKKRRKLKELLAEIPCCEIVMESSSDKKSSKMLVRLREDLSAGCDSSRLLPPEQEPIQKKRKVPSAEIDADGRSNGGKLREASLERAKPADSNSMLADTSKMAVDVDTPDVSDDVAGFRRSEMSRDKLKVSSANQQDTLLADEGLVAVLERYKSNGALGADDLLEQMFPDGKPGGAHALGSIIRKELDPNGDIDLSVTKDHSPSKLSKTLCALANAMSLSGEYPQQARLQAQLALEHAKSLAVELPATWLERMKALADLSSLRRSSALPASSADIPRDEWEDIVANDRNAPPVMHASILPMIGLEEVKRKFINMYHRLKVAKDQGDSAAASYNVRFEGNPGTGKTTIARHYGEFLRQVGVLGEKSLFRETTGAKIIHDGVKALKDILDEIKEAGGGVVFVDEAYQLVSEREGKKALDFILPSAESLTTEYGKLVWVFAGYKKQMEKLFEHNDGLPSRFPFRFIFEDYSNEELQQIFEDMMIYIASPSNKPADKSRTKQTQVSNTAYGLPGRVIVGSTMSGRQGGTWTYKANMGWTDCFGNLTVNPAQVGSMNSQLVTTAGDFWTERNGEWVDQAGRRQFHYPGSPPPSRTDGRERRATPFSCHNPKHLRIAIKRLGRSRGENGFGNARAVCVLFEKVRDRQAARIAEERKHGRAPCVFTFTETDLLGPKVTEATLKESSAWKQLESMEGLLPVKESVAQMFKMVLKNVEREKREERLYDISLNRVFLGNPGTGKTTVAEIYGQILADLGLLSKGEVVMKCASDFIGDALGQSEKLTQNILQAAEGSVLVIDEAYSLYSGGSGKTGSNDPYKTAVIDTIVEKVQAKPGADIAVIMLGYKEEMEEMMRNVNPGLSRRFQIENAFIFPDFDDASLCRIMMESARQKEVKLTIDVAKRAVRMLAKTRAKPNFGNAGSVNNLLSKAILSMQAREKAVELIPADFGCSGDGPDTNMLDSLFDDLIGCTEIKDIMADLRATVEFSIAQGSSPSDNVGFNYLFLGNPGTGKTTVARRMGKMFHALGLLASDELREAKASDLLTGYSGQAGKQTRELLKQSRGGVLFIDEAYQLNPNRGGHYMTEAVDELVGALTDEEFKGKLLVVLAGYEEDMEEMLQNTNPGMRSRFSERVPFCDFDAYATVELLQSELRKRSIPLDVEGSNRVSQMAERLVNSDGFANGRDIVTWADRTYKAIAKKYSNIKERKRGYISMTSSIDNVEEALNDMLSSREVRLGGQKCGALTRSGRDATEGEDQTKSPPPPPLTKVLLETEMDREARETDSNLVAEEQPENLFEGIDGSVLRKLQDFIDEQDLGSEGGARRLASIDPGSKEFADLVARLQRELNMSHEDATSQLTEWQSRHEDLEEVLTKQVHKEKTLGVRPIWRCGVCAQADKPWIACYVAPFIVRYEKVPL